MTTQIFISYRREDTADITGRIYDRLTYKYGAPAVFKDVDSIPPGSDFRKYLDSKIKECAVVLVVVGDGWLKKDPATGATRLENPHDFVRIEIESALKREIPVIPLLVEGASWPPQEKLPEGMQEFVYRQARVVGHDPDFRLHMEALIADLERIFDTCRPVPPPVSGTVQRPVPPPVRSAFQRPPNTRPLPPSLVQNASGPGPAQQTSGSGKWILLVIVITTVIVGIIFFLSVLAGLSNQGLNNY
ncbi:MAG: toll/interleukin-1 receptor domain-containing protein [Acidobacteria bacterium]|nr:toll/interleukin-1 receptor domain-containing protein [Acidobacteriota bacterium]